MALFKFRNPFKVAESTGVSVSNLDEFAGSQQQSTTISIGQEVEVTSDVTFNDVSPTKIIIGGSTQNIVLSYGSISGSITQTYGDSFVVSENLTAQSDMTVVGNITAQKIESSLTASNTIYESGSTEVGDTSTDSHEVTGSILISGSFGLNNYSVSEFSSDISASDQSTSAIITEEVAYNQFTSITNENTYIRKKYVQSGSILSGATASFTALTASAVGSLSATTKQDFTFFNNGMVIEYDAIDIEQSGSKFLMKVNPSSLGYGLDSTDEIVAWGKFDNQYYLDFDGSNDELQTTFSGSSATPLPVTYSWWMKSTETGRNYSVFGYGGNRKAFTTNYSSNRPLLWQANQWHIFWDDTSAQDDGNWHHWMLYNQPQNLSECKLYVDGTLIDINTISDSGTLAVMSQPLTIGAYKNNSTNASHHFEGGIREFAVFGGDKTSKATTYYNGGVAYDLTNESNLQGYWKMNDVSGTKVRDWSGEGNHGTVNGATWNVYL
tara:strand:+ start:1866 stop:3347 length:1482 start_codon:yes stop_codon:yes gene_type:complete